MNGLHKVTTPTATMPIEPEWSNRFYRTKSGRWRKRTKKGTEGSMSWAQEMLCRAVAEDNPDLLPTAEACEEHMGFPRGWTNISGEPDPRPNWHGRLPSESIEDSYARAVKALKGMPRNVVRVKGKRG